MDIRKAIFEFVIATIPVGILYFGGWAYLNYFLATFGISISEISIDTQTILIYSVAPVSVAFFAFWKWIFSAAILILALSIFSSLFNLHICARFGKSASSIKIFILALPTVLQLFAVLLMSTLFFLVVLLPGIRWSAQQVANRLWTSTGVVIDLIVKQEGSNAEWISNFQSCAGRRALELIYSDQVGYYALCKSPADPDSGIVFEVRRSGGLVSIRFARREIQ